MYDSVICVIANKTENTPSGMFASIMPENKNIAEGVIDNSSARSTPGFFHSTTHPSMYTSVSAQFTARYAVSAQSNQNPKYVYGTLTIIRIKQPNRPICSQISSGLFS